MSGKPTFNGAPVLRDSHEFRMAPKVAGVRLVLHVEVCLGRVQWFEIQIGPRLKTISGADFAPGLDSVHFLEFRLGRFEFQIGSV